MNFSESQKKGLDSHDFMLKTKGMLLILMYTERPHDISNLIVKQIQRTLQKHKESCTVSWLAKGRLGIRTFRSLKATPEVCFEIFPAPNAADGRSNLNWQRR